ncbi:hypothetical protein NC661_19405 [Aquibacillus koreensis]|uniref:Lipoprotein n=1 Tax=Aquibacillus koreensis TaxID=279446 RepID=A0A9X3WPU0_9BACI|nr:hypothetical protein [Aquibacillus koreensis]MCT2535358.1 hypothetical protein [Aquibacillus koreensis]MDC3422523.1 hypothetical protein [Aquibacillus koreensis]
MRILFRGVFIKQLILILIALSLSLTVGCVEKEESDQGYPTLIRLNGELYYIPKTVEESVYNRKELLGTVTDPSSKVDEIPEEDFTSNSLDDVEVYSVEESNDIFVIPYETKEYGSRYHVLEKYDGDQ